MKRLLDVLQASADYLAGKGVEQPRLVAEQLMSHVLKCPRLQLYVRFEKDLDESQLVPLRAGLKRLGAGEPLQYVVGDTGFMGHTFKVDRRALIPRPDTETLIAAVLECGDLWSRPSVAVADIGTGSGCVAVSLVLGRPEVRVMAVDLHPEVLDLARENAVLNGVAGRIEFRQGDLLQGLGSEMLDAVAANLPYIATEDCAKLPCHIRAHEPLSALDGGPDGLDLIRRLTREARVVLKPGGWLFLEIGFDQGPAVVGWLIDNGFVNVTVRPDLGGRDRVVSGTVAK